MRGTVDGSQMRATEQYEFDWKFYVAILLIAAVLVGGIVIGRRMVLQAQGRHVQQLLTKTNLADIEFSRKQARTYVRGLAERHNLTPSERKKAEEIFTRAFHERMSIWVDDRLQGQSEAHTRKRQSESWDGHMEEFNQLLKERS
jgi:hypothetical protein